MQLKFLTRKDIDVPDIPQAAAAPVQRSQSLFELREQIGQHDDDENGETEQLNASIDEAVAVGGAVDARP